MKGGSTFSSTLRSVDQEASSQAVLRWRSWPLVEHKRWSWLVALGIIALGGACAYLGQSWLPGLLAVGGLAVTLWQFFVPVGYKIDSLGLRRSALGRTRVFGWQGVRAYQVRPTGIVLFQRPDPTAVDLLRSIFIPYPADEDEVLCALREHLSHAVELPP
jgi:hypothetical protein